MLVKTLGGYNALRLRAAFLILSLVITIVPIGRVQPEHKTVEEPTTEVTTETTTDPTKAEDYYIAMKAESYEKNIYVRFYKADGETLFDGIEFEVEVEDSNKEKKTYKDEDKDGKLNIEGVVPGNATVTAKAVENHEIQNNPLTIYVRDKIEIRLIENIVKEQTGVAEDGQRAAQNTEVPADTVKHRTDGKSYGKFTIDEYIAVDNSTIAITETSEESQGDSQNGLQEEQQGEDSDQTAETVADLKDKSGNVLYVKDGDKYVVAKESEYNADSTYYKKVTTTHYYGWTLVEGKTYYYDADENKVTGSQVIDGARYDFDANGALQQTLGIDVSAHNGSIDWQAVKNSGITFVIIRVGFRGYGSRGSLNTDRRFEENYAGAKAAGLRVGAYFFSQATNNTEALEEASYAIEVLAGRQLDLPLFLDIENACLESPSDVGRADNNSKETWNGIASTFCQTVSTKSAYGAGVYTNCDYLSRKIDRSSFGAYSLWIADWRDRSTPGVSGSSIWQYSSSGKVAGISGNVDMNRGYI